MTKKGVFQPVKFPTPSATIKWSNPVYAVLFCVADMEFSKFTKKCWISETKKWAEECDLEHSETKEFYYELVEVMGGDEWFVTFI